MEKENEADRRKEKELQLQKFQDWHKKLTDMINWLLKVEQDVSSYEKDSNDQQSLKSLIAQYQVRCLSSMRSHLLINSFHNFGLEKLKNSVFLLSCALLRS